MTDQDREKVIDQIKALNEDWLTAAAARDIAGMMVIYAEEAQELLPDMPALVGKTAIRAFYERLIEQFPRFAHHFAPESATVSASCDLAVMRGRYIFTPDLDVPQTTHEGKYVGVWRPEDETWRLFINISNGDGV